nr:hypothetical protein [Angustibacter aerolatus]
MQASVGAATDVGRVRSDNEDAYVATAPVYFVADGMGGHAAGEVASALVVEALADLAGRTDLTPSQVVDQARRGERAGRRLGPHPPRARGHGHHGDRCRGGRGRRRRAAGRVQRRRQPGLRACATTGCARSAATTRWCRSSSTPASCRRPRRCGTRTATSSPARWAATTSRACRSSLVEPAAGQRFVVCSDGLSDEVEAGTIRTVLLAARTPATRPARWCRWRSTPGARQRHRAGAGRRRPRPGGCLTGVDEVLRVVRSGVRSPRRPRG